MAILGQHDLSPAGIAFRAATGSTTDIMNTWTINRLAISVIGPVLATAPTLADNPPAFPVWIGHLAITACHSEHLSEQDLTSGIVAAGFTMAAIEPIAATDAASGLRLALDDGGEIRLMIRLPGTDKQRVRVTHSPAPGSRDADLFVQVAPGCSIDLARMVLRDGAGRPERLIGYEGNPLLAVTEEDLNPPVPPGIDPGGIAVASVDTGIAYTLPMIAGRLARDARGRILGHDFADGDDRPFDLDPSRPAVFPVRHGTAVASILMREAPEARLVPLRYPAGAHERFADMVEHIAAGPARIVAMALGGARREEWEPFETAARRHREILFVVSAGNDGRDIDAEPVYPAAFDLDNVLVVTSTDAFGRLPPESNWGASSVDIAVPGERIDVVDHRGAAGKASGTSYAVPRIAALAARMMARHPGRDTQAIKAAIVALAVPLEDRSRPVAAGWIPNPAIE